MQPPSIELVSPDEAPECGVETYESINKKTKLKVENLAYIYDDYEDTWFGLKSRAEGWNF